MFIPLCKPPVEENDFYAVKEVLESGWLSTGKKANEFEDMFAEYKGAKTCITTSSGTAALDVAIKSLNIPCSSQIITTPFTFIATAFAIKKAGHRPVFVDIGWDLNINPEKIEEAITLNTKAILVVHFGGRPCKMDAIMGIAKKYNLKVVEDCCHAIETTYMGKHVGTFGDYGCFSFGGAKNMSCGEGGAIISMRDEKEKLRRATMQGLIKDKEFPFFYECKKMGDKCNLTDIQASLLTSQLRRIYQINRRRKMIAEYYNEELKEFRTSNRLSKDSNHSHAHHLYTIFVYSETRKKVIRELRERGIGTSVHYGKIIPEFELFTEPDKHVGYTYPHALYISSNILSIPMYPQMTDEEVEYVAKNVKEVVDESIRT